MKLSDIRRVLIIGAGTMGQQIGLDFAIHGYDVVFYDLTQDILDQAMKRVGKLGSWYASIGRITNDHLQQTLARITTTPDPREAARDADLINESVLEDPDVKAKVFAQFNELCPERTIFTTNTSMLVPSQFAAATGRPEKLCALHFHDLRSNRVVDVMPHPGTDHEVTKLVSEFAESNELIVIMLHQEHNGYVFNNMLTSLFASALGLASRDVASPEDVDRAWMGVMGMFIGPFGMMDQVGLGTVWHILDYWARVTGDAQTRKNADFVRQFVDRGELGYKSKKGFYSYPGPSYGDAGFLKGEKKEM